MLLTLDKQQGWFRPLGLSRGLCRCLMGLYYYSLGSQTWEMHAQKKCLSLSLCLSLVAMYDAKIIEKFRNGGIMAFRKHFSFPFLSLESFAKSCSYGNVTMITMRPILLLQNRNSGSTTKALTVLLISEMERSLFFGNWEGFY